MPDYEKMLVELIEAFNPLMEAYQRVRYDRGNQLFNEFYPATINDFEQAIQAHSDASYTLYHVKKSKAEEAMKKLISESEKAGLYR